MKHYTKLLHNLWFVGFITVGAQAATIEELEARLLRLEQEASLLKQEIIRAKQSATTNSSTSNAAQTDSQQTGSPKLSALNAPIMLRPDNLQPQRQAAVSASNTEAETTPTNTQQTEPSAQQEVTPVENSNIATANNDSTTTTNSSSSAAAPMPMELLLAISQVQSGSFSVAENALNQYVQNDQNLHLDRAYYWLGEATYRQNKFEEASKHFTQAYLKNKKGVSAPDSLIRLGMSLARIDKKQEACKVLNVVERDFPNENVKVKIAQGEKQRIQCS